MKSHEIRKIYLDKMGELFIKCDSGHVFYMPCPLYSHPETSRSCGTTCPWFAVGGFEKMLGKFVYCREHVIGELISNQ